MKEIGGYVATDCVLQETLPKDISSNRMKHVLGRYEKNASSFYKEFQHNDELFYALPLREMSKLTSNIMRAVDYAAVQEKRNTNYAILDQMLGSTNMLVPKTPIGPYCYPFYCEDGMKLKQQLAALKIYIPTLWPNVLNMESTLEKDYAENILPIPCDQRYGIEDMVYLSRIVAARKS